MAEDQSTEGFTPAAEAPAPAPAPEPVATEAPTMPEAEAPAPESGVDEQEPEAPAPEPDELTAEQLVQRDNDVRGERGVTEEELRAVRALMAETSHREKLNGRADEAERTAEEKRFTAESKAELAAENPGDYKSSLDAMTSATDAKFSAERAERARKEAKLQADTAAISGRGLERLAEQTDKELEKKQTAADPNSPSYDPTAPTYTGNDNAAMGFQYEARGGMSEGYVAERRMAGAIDALAGSGKLDTKTAGMLKDRFNRAGAEEREEITAIAQGLLAGEEGQEIYSESEKKLEVYGRKREVDEAISYTSPQDEGFRKYLSTSLMSDDPKVRDEAREKLAEYQAEMDARYGESSDRVELMEDPEPAYTGQGAAKTKEEILGHMAENIDPEIYNAVTEEFVKRQGREPKAEEVENLVGMAFLLTSASKDAESLKELGLDKLTGEEISRINNSDFGNLYNASVLILNKEFDELDRMYPDGPLTKSSFLSKDEARQVNGIADGQIPQVAPAAAITPTLNNEQQEALANGSYGQENPQITTSELNITPKLKNGTPLGKEASEAIATKLQEALKENPNLGFSVSDKGVITVQITHPAGNDLEALKNVLLENKVNPEKLDKALEPIRAQESLMNQLGDVGQTIGLANADLGSEVNVARTTPTTSKEARPVNSR